jgi:hypothetical protein
MPDAVVLLLQEQQQVAASTATASLVSRLAGCAFGHLP